MDRELERLAIEWAEAIDARWDPRLAFPREEPQYTKVVKTLHDAQRDLYLAAKKLKEQRDNVANTTGGNRDSADSDPATS